MTKKDRVIVVISIAWPLLVIFYIEPWGWSSINSVWLYPIAGFGFLPVALYWAYRFIKGGKKEFDATTIKNSKIIMSKKHDDKLALEHLSIIDMERVMKSLDYISEFENQHLKAALFRDAVISYAKPFSSNKFSDQSKGLRISFNHVPNEMTSLHKEIINLRNELIAHTDMTLQNPRIKKYEDEVGKNYSMTVAGYETIHKEHLFGPLYKLAKAVHGSLIAARS